MELRANCVPNDDRRDLPEGYCDEMDISKTEIHDAHELYCLLIGEPGDYGGNASDHYDIRADIVIDGDWTPIVSLGFKTEESETNYLPITLDGHGHTITGLNAALFATVYGGTVIKNLHLREVTRNPDYVVYGYSGDGAFLQSGAASFVNCSASGEITGDETHDTIGGFLGNSHNNGSSILSFTNCINYVNIKAGGHVGGFAGSIHAFDEIWFDRCANYGSITVPNMFQSYSIGGFVGEVALADQLYVKSNDGYSVNYGTINGKHIVFNGIENQPVGSQFIGGFAGHTLCNDVKIRNFINNGKIITAGDLGTISAVGGIVGGVDTKTTEFTNCISNADVTCEGPLPSRVGGIAGYFYARGVEEEDDDVTCTFVDNYVSNIVISGACDEVDVDGGAAGLACFWEIEPPIVAAHGNYVTATHIHTGYYGKVGRLFNRAFGNEGDDDYVYDNYAKQNVLLTGGVIVLDCDEDAVQLSDSPLPDNNETDCPDVPFKGGSLRNGADAEANSIKIPHILIFNSRNLDPEKTVTWVDPLLLHQRIDRAAIDIDFANERPEHIPPGAKFICWSLDEAGNECVTDIDQIHSNVAILFAQYVCCSPGFNYVEGPGCVFVSCPPGCKRVGPKACECEGLSGNVLDSLGEIVASIAAGESGGAEVIKAGAAALAVIKNPLAALVGSEKRQLIDGVYNIYKNIADMECVMLRKLCCSVRAVCNCGNNDPCADCCTLPTGMQNAMEDIVSSIADVESASGNLMLESAYVIEDTVDSYTDVGELQDIMNGIQGLTCITSQIENTMADKLCMSLNAACGCSGPSGMAQCVSVIMSDSISKVIESISDTEQGAGKLVQFGAEALGSLDTATTSAQDVLAVMNTVGNLADSALAIEQASMRKLCSSLSVLCPNDNNPPLCPDVPLDCAGICGATFACGKYIQGGI
ncbi:hypothetical protein AGMMS49992_10180 [Clostridia bacterium]|nr:hypothetical protein AGMMS49992_10180 [Clostridia bacterium]